MGNMDIDALSLDLMRIDYLEPCRNLDGVLHRMLIGPATFVTLRPPIMDGGQNVPSYTASLEAAATLFDCRLAPGEWSLQRTWEFDEIRLTPFSGTALAARCPRGKAAVILSFMVLAAALNIRTETEWAEMALRIRALAEDTEARRRIEKV